MIEKDPKDLVSHIKNIGMRLKAIGSRIQNCPLGKHLPFSQLLFQKVGQIDIEIDLPLWGSLAIPSGITVSAPKETTIGNIEGGDPLKTTELGRGKHPAFSLPRNNLIAFQFCTHSWL